MAMMCVRRAPGWCPCRVRYCADEAGAAGASAGAAGVAGAAGAAGAVVPNWLPAGWGAGAVAWVRTVVCVLALGMVYAATTESTTIRPARVQVAFSRKLLV